MKITKRQLQRIIKEELSAVLGESGVQEGVMDTLRGAKGLEQETNDQPIDPNQPHQSDEQLKKNREEEQKAWKEWYDEVKAAYGGSIAQRNRCAYGISGAEGRKKCGEARKELQARFKSWRNKRNVNANGRIKIGVGLSGVEYRPSPLWPADTFTAPDDNGDVWWPRRINY